MRVAAVSMVLLGVVACGLCAGGGGCGRSGGRVDVTPGELPEGVALPDAATVVRGYEPARVLIHPLSRLEGAGAARRAVVHVQVLDVFGHDVKWPGAVRVQVDQSGGWSGEGGQRGEVHFVDLTQGEANARAFDSISRCYVVRVPVPGDGGVTVKVRWLLLDSSGRTQAMEAAGQLPAVK